MVPLRGKVALLLLGLAVPLLLFGCRALELKRADLAARSGWLTEGASEQRRHAVAAPVVPPLEEVWEYNAAAGFGPGSPLILGGTILVANRKGEVHAIDFDTGRKAGMASFGEAIEGTPIVQEGRLFVPVAGGRWALRAYDLVRGEALWGVKGPAVETGLLPLGEAFVAVNDAGQIGKYDNRDGTLLWERALGEDVSVHATPVLALGRVIVADDRGNLAALDPDDGAVVWTEALHTPVYASLAAGEALLFVPTTRARFFALDAAQGHVRWRFTLPDTTVRFSAPALDGDLVVFGASDGKLRALDAASGTVRWTFDADAALAAAPLITQRTVYVGSMGKKLFALDRATGAVRWEQELEGRIKSALAVRDGYLVVLAEPRTVYLFKSASATHHATSP